MKKIFTLLWLTLVSFSFKATAQSTPNCNAEFAVQYLTNYTVKFNPAITGDSPFVRHFWNFGDGTTGSQLISPIHTFALPGTYAVRHTVLRVTPNNVPVCTQTFTKHVTITAPCTLVANFSWSSTAANPLTIAFQNLSVPLSNTDSIKWTFGDGSSSTAVNPVHTYNAPGTYTVCLRVKKLTPPGAPPCVKEICKTIVIPQPCNLQVYFSSQPDPNHPLRIKFTNLSSPVSITDSVKWTFGDGNSVSGVMGDPNVANPTHNYANAGTYTVCLRIKRNGTPTTPVQCVREFCKTIIVYQPCNLVVNFTSQPDPNNPLRIKFTNTSTPIHPTDSVRWTFGDGSSVSGVQSDPNVANPIHIYANAGTFTVCLRIKKNSNISTPNQVACIREKCNTIVITHPCNFPVNFSWRLDSINPRKVYFTNLSIPPVSSATAVWTFGDGSAATSWNAVHEYAHPGRYIVCLKVYLPNSNCFRTKCDTIVIPNPPPPCTQLSKYTYQVSPNDNQKYKFTPDYINPALQYTWTFGDGTGSHAPVAVHRYAQPGIYIACLTVWRGPECASTTCKEIRVLPQVNCDTAHAWYTYQRNPNIPNKIQFTAHATIPIIDQVWYITKVSGTVTLPPVILHQNNPVYVFQDTGLFKVCLKAKLDGGCMKEYCSNIRIEQVSNACELQAFPNPASSAVHVNIYLTQPELILATVYNSLNVPVLSHTQQGHTGNNLVTLNVNNLIPGQYTIRLVYGNRVCYARFQKL
jgi:PKD repeat protein